MKSIQIFTKAVCAVVICQLAVFAVPKKVMHLSGIGKRTHASVIPTVTKFMDELAQEHNFEVTHVKKSSAVADFDDYDVVLFNNTAFESFQKAEEQEKLKTWFNGGKAMGIHSSCDCRGPWKWWQNTVCSGSTYKSDFFGAFTLQPDPEIDKLPAFRKMWDENKLGEDAEFAKTELYVFNASPRSKEGVTMFHIVGKDFSEVEDHSFGWHKAIGDSGEFIYSALGHQNSDFASGWVKKAIWAWMKYLTGDYEPAVGVDGEEYYPFARLDMEKDFVHIKDEGRHSVRVFDLQGRLRYHWRGSGEKMHAYHGLEAGIYYLQVKSEHLDYTHAVVIQ